MELHKIHRDDNIDTVKRELQAKGVLFDNNLGQRAFLLLLKENERAVNLDIDPKYFKSSTDYDNFKWDVV
eukprot:15346276-Ditylum_brightwellii.AAC.1